MARSDYQCCSICGDKIVYSDDYDRDDGCACGSCVATLRARVEELERELSRVNCIECANRRTSKAVDPEGWRDLDMGSVECEKHAARASAGEG